MWIGLFLCLSHLFIGVMLSIKCFQKWEFQQKTKKGVDHMRGVVCKKGVKASAQFEDEKWVGQKGVSTSINVLYLKFYQKHVQHPKNSPAKIRVKQKNISNLLLQVSSVSALYHLHVLEIFSDSGMILNEMRVFFSWLTIFSRTLHLFHWNKLSCLLVESWTFLCNNLLLMSLKKVKTMAKKPTKI